MNPLHWTNATKAQVMAVLNAGLATARAFGLELTNDQMNALTAFLNVLFMGYMASTYQMSPKRVPDLPTSGHL